MDTGEKKRHLTEEEILKISKNAIHKTFGDFGLRTIDGRNKGGLGGFVEQNIFGYSANSDDNPDFIDAGIELKVTPMKQNSDGSYSSKERLVLNLINYQSEAEKTFKTSSFYTKNRRLLIWFYLYSQGVNPSEFEILNCDLFEFEKSVQYKVIERDWNIIHDKIVEGRAHEISESDTEFLAACTKGANGSVLTRQYNSDIPAKPRAYSFKSSFMTHLYRLLIHNVAPYDPSISEEEWMKNPLEEIYKEKFAPFQGKTQDELMRMLGFTTKSKQKNFMIAQRLLGAKGRKGTFEMQIAGITFRTLTICKNTGTPTEAMPFEAFEFGELIYVPWEESQIRESFVDLKVMLFVFEEDARGVIRFKKLYFWNVPNRLVDGAIREMHEQCAEMVRKGEALTLDSRGKVCDRFPKENRDSNGVCHVRPHARNARDVYELPVRDKATGKTTYTKQSFWFNREYIKRVLKDLDNLDE